MSWKVFGIILAEIIWVVMSILIQMSDAIRTQTEPTGDEWFNALGAFLLCNLLAGGMYLIKCHAEKTAWRHRRKKARDNLEAGREVN